MKAPLYPIQRSFSHKETGTSRSDRSSVDRWSTHRIVRLSFIYCTNTRIILYSTLYYISVHQLERAMTIDWRWLRAVTRATGRWCLQAAFRCAAWTSGSAAACGTTRTEHAARERLEREFKVGEPGRRQDGHLPPDRVLLAQTARRSLVLLAECEAARASGRAARPADRRARAPNSRCISRSKTCICLRAAQWVASYWLNGEIYSSKCFTIYQKFCSSPVHA